MPSENLAPGHLHLGASELGQNDKAQPTVPTYNSLGKGFQGLHLCLVFLYMIIVVEEAISLYDNLLDPFLDSSSLSLDSNDKSPRFLFNLRFDTSALSSTKDRNVCRRAEREMSLEKPLSSEKCLLNWLTIMQK